MNLSGRVIFLLTLALSRGAYGEECEKGDFLFNGLTFGASKQDIEKSLNFSITWERVNDLETSGQNSGWLYRSQDLDIFVAEQGGLSMVLAKSPLFAISEQYRVGMSITDIPATYRAQLKGHEVKIKQCQEYAIMEKELIIAFDESGRADEVKIIEYGL